MRNERFIRCKSLYFISLTYPHIANVCTYVCSHTNSKSALYTPALVREYRKLKDWRRSVVCFPLASGQAFPFGEGSESKFREQERGEKSMLNENCGFDCEQIAVRLPNVRRQLFMPGETRL